MPLPTPHSPRSPALVRSVLVGLGAVALFVAASSRALWPLPLFWAEKLTPGPGDAVLNLYFLEWGQHQLSLGLPSFWDANFYFPVRGAFTLSDHLFGPALQLFLLRPLLPSPVAGYNLLFFTSFVLSGLSTAWVARRMGASRPAALLAGGMFAFCPMRWDQLSHLQVLLMQWLPLALWHFDRLLVERSARRGAIFLAFYLLNLTGGSYLAYMLHVPLLALAVVRGLSLWRKGGAREVPTSGVGTAQNVRPAVVGATPASPLHPLVVFGSVGAVALIAIALLFGPYLQTAKRLGTGRKPAEIEKMAATPWSYLAPARTAPYFGPDFRNAVERSYPNLEHALTRSENSLFPGILATIFGIAGAIVAFRGRRANETVSLDPLWVRGLALGALVSGALTFGAVYLPLMKVVPGLSGMRVPTRFAVFVTLALALFSALGIDALVARLGRKQLRAPLFVALALFLVWESTPRRIRLYRVPARENFPAVYAYLAKTPEVRSIIEIPIASNPSEVEYMLYSTAHWKPIANGHSGYETAIHREIASRIATLPESAVLDRLRELGLTHLVLHTDHHRLRRARARLETWEQSHADRLRLVHVAGEARVYALVAPNQNTPNRAGW